MNDDNILGGVLSQFGQTVKQAAKQAVKIPEEMAKDLGSQVGGAPRHQDSAGQAKPDEELAKNKPQQQWPSDNERIKFLKDLYGKSDMSKDGSVDSIKNKNPQAQPNNNKPPSEFEKQIADKSPDEQKKLMELRNQLHKENYYDPTFNPVKKQEERPAEKVENEKKQEMQDLQKKEEKKPQPLAVVREQNKAEMFRGASG